MQARCSLRTICACTLMLSILTLMLVDCGAAPPDSYFQPIDKAPFTEEQREERDLKLRILLKETLDKFKPEIEDTWERVIDACANEKEREILKRVTLDYSDDTTPFYFETQIGDSDTITISAGGFCGVVFLAHVCALQNVKFIPIEAVIEYCAVCRICIQHGATLLPPYPEICEKAINENEAFFKTSNFFRQEMLFYILAHEAGHVINRDSAEQRDGEDREAFFARLNNQEGKADSHAFAAIIRSDTLPVVVTMMMVFTAQIYEPRPKPFGDAVVNPHPPDFFRAHMFARFSRDALKNGLVPSITDPQEREQYIQGQDEMAQQTSEKNVAAAIRARDHLIHEGIFPNMKVKYVKPDESN